ncbi:ABC transporter ATP-binding protein [Paraflavisolibacter sp. H34]|uniref:ABC transporter ATP-binding protein n=1 Tax=Huijunlia imazamoxiresistens TaxID=3127457 RepID=UPI00301A8615
MNELLHIKNLTVDFTGEQGSTRAVNDLSLTINRGEIVALVGESGSGKSVTSLSVLRLLPEPPARYVQGSILFTENGQSVDLLALPPKALQRIRGNGIAMIFQEPMTALNPVLTCGKQITEALLQHKNLTPLQAKEEAIGWLEKVQLPRPEELYQRYPHQLSGGQKQRVMIALAMCCRPSLLICDEPTTALDVTVQKSILELIRQLQQEHQMGVLFITHDLGVVAELAHRVAIMYRGELIEQNTVENIFRQPVQAYTKALLACRPALHPKGQRLPVVGDFLGNPAVPAPTSAAPSPVAQQAGGTLLSIQQLSVAFPVTKNFWGTPTRFFTAVDDVSFDIHSGETLGLVGESGCGKTTLGRTLLRLTEPTKGRILFRQQDITALDRPALRPFRREVQLVFQDPFSSLNPRLTIGDALEEPLDVFGLYGGRRQRREQVAGLLDKVGLPAAFAKRYPHEASGGQRQRVVIARALALNPHFLVCDESVSALDVSVQAQVLNLLNDLKNDLGLTLLFISHDLSVVRYMSDRILVMKAGKIVEAGTAEAVYRHPQSAYTKELLAAIPGRI